MDPSAYLKKVVDPCPRKMHIYTKFVTLFQDFIDVVLSPESPHEALF